MSADSASAASSVVTDRARCVGAGAELLSRVKTGRTLPVCRRLGNGSYVSRIGAVEIQVIDREITISTSAGHRSEAYR